MTEMSFYLTCHLAARSQLRRHESWMVRGMARGQLPLLVLCVYAALCSACPDAITDLTDRRLTAGSRVQQVRDRAVFTSTSEENRVACFPVLE